MELKVGGDERGFALTLVLFGILAVALVMLGSFYLKNQASPELVQFKINPSGNKSSVKTSDKYINKELGFELTLPSKEYEIKIDSEGEFNKRVTGGTVKAVADIRKNFTGYVQYAPGSFLWAISVLGKDKSFDKSPFTVWVFENPNNLTSEAWYGKYWYYPFVWGAFDYSSKKHVYPEKTATVSGYLAKWANIYYQPGNPKMVLLSKDEKMYLFRVMESSGEEILRSFKFSN